MFEIAGSSQNSSRGDGCAAEGSKARRAFFHPLCCAVHRQIIVISPFSLVAATDADSSAIFTTAVCRLIRAIARGDPADTEPAGDLCVTDPPYAAVPRGGV